MELCGSNVKKFLIFQETELFYISGNRNPKKLLIFEELTFQAQEIKKIHPKKILIFQEMETKKKCIMFSQYFLIFSFISKNGNKEKKPSYFGKRYFFIFRILVHCVPETYLEHCQRFTMERPAKIATQRTFLYSWKGSFLA